MELADEIWEQRKASQPELVKKQAVPADIRMRELEGESVVADDVTENQAIWPSILDNKPADDKNELRWSIFIVSMISWFPIQLVLVNLAPMQQEY